MILFLKKIGIAALIAFLVLNISAYFVCQFPDIAFVMGYTKEWIRVKKGVEASSQKIKSDTLYVGDSVAGQFVPYNGTNQLTLNGSIYTIGNYILAYNSIQNNPQLKAIVYLSVPQVLGYSFERQQTCNNFIKPFLNFKNKKHLSSSLLKKLDKYPSSGLYYFPFYKVLPVSEIDFEELDKADKKGLSDISLEYLTKLYELCEENNVELILASPPVAESLNEKTKHWKKMRNQVSGSKLEGLFDRYFASIQYKEDRFLRDHIHWKESFLKENRKAALEAIRANFKYSLGSRK